MSATPEMKKIHDETMSHIKRVSQLNGKIKAIRKNAYLVKHLIEKNEELIAANANDADKRTILLEENANYQKSIESYWGELALNSTRIKFEINTIRNKQIALMKMIDEDFEYFELEGLEDD